MPKSGVHLSWVVYAVNGKISAPPEASACPRSKWPFRAAKNPCSTSFSTGLGRLRISLMSVLKIQQDELGPKDLCSLKK